VALPLSSAPHIGDGPGDEAFRLAWLLFIVAKAQILREAPDLISSFNLLLCVVNVVLAHADPAWRSAPLSDTSRFPVRAASSGADSLRSIAARQGASLSEVRAWRAASSRGVRGSLLQRRARQPPPEACEAASAAFGTAKCVWSLVCTARGRTSGLRRGCRLQSPLPRPSSRSFEEGEAHPKP
jgi:Domain of unknown function (DUF3452)